ncbi:Dyp-type peroxidase [Frankia sp. AgB32]|nr:Dyp-type peroxidase [Frankia sp. AgB32]
MFFLAYQRDPRRQFVTIRRSLAGKADDALNEYIQHVGSGLFACPPGAAPGEYRGQRLLAQQPPHQRAHRVSTREVYTRVIVTL